MKLFKKFSIVSLIVLLFLSIAMSATLTSFAQEPVTLVVSTMQPIGSIYYRALEYFAKKVDEYYDGPIKIELHPSGELGSEQDAFEYMAQGLSIDVNPVSPPWMSTWDKRAPFMEAPFLFKNQAAWKEAIETGVFKSITDQLIEKGVRVIGYGGGAMRNLVLNQPVWRTADLSGVEIRVQNSPLHQNVFNAIGLKATPLDYLQTYEAINSGVLDGLENEVSSMVGKKFYEVAPYYVLTNHVITINAICISEKRFQSFPKALQEAILKAGSEAGAWWVATDANEADKIVEDLVEKGQMKVIKFYNTEIRKRALPVVEEYAREIGAEDILEAIKAINAKH